MIWGPFEIVLRYSRLHSRMGLQGKNNLGDFDQFSDDYQELVDRSIRIAGEKGGYFAAYKAAFIAARIAPKSDCKILDYGCGIGLVSGQIKRVIPCARIDGYDISKGSLDQIDSVLRAQGKFTCEVSELDRDYDVVIIANVLHHVRPATRQATISRAAELIAGNGSVVVFEHNPANPLTRRAVESCPFDKDAILLRPRETLGCLRQTGFKKIRLDYIVFFPHLLRWLRPHERYLGWCPLGAQYVVTGSKE